MKPAKTPTYPDLGARYVYNGIREERCGKVFRYIGMREVNQHLRILQFASEDGVEIELAQSVWQGVMTRV